MILDVHNHTLEEAIEEIIYKFDECKECGDNSLQIIHGHKHGTAIRDYIRSDKFLSEVAKTRNKVIERNFSQEGVTIFKLKISITPSNITPIIDSKSNEKKEGTKISLEICFKCNETMILLKDFNWYKCPKCGKLKKR